MFIRLFGDNGRGQSPPFREIVGSSEIHGSVKTQDHASDKEIWNRLLKNLVSLLISSIHGVLIWLSCFGLHPKMKHWDK
jgi:hypothetical protein